VNLILDSCTLIWLASELPAHHKDPFDRVILAQALMLNLPRRRVSRRSIPALRRASRLVGEMGQGRLRDQYDRFERLPAPMQARKVRRRASDWNLVAAARRLNASSSPG